MRLIKPYVEKAPLILDIDISDYKQRGTLENKGSCIRVTRNMDNTYQVTNVFYGEEADKIYDFLINHAKTSDGGTL